MKNNGKTISTREKALVGLLNTFLSALVLGALKRIFFLDHKACFEAH